MPKKKIGDVNIYYEIHGKGDPCSHDHWAC